MKLKNTLKTLLRPKNLLKTVVSATPVAPLAEILNQLEGEDVQQRLAALEDNKQGHEPEHRSSFLLSLHTLGKVPSSFKIVGGDGKEYGPIDLATLLQWTREGRISSQTQVWDSRAGSWQPAMLIAELAAVFGGS